MRFRSIAIASLLALPASAWSGDGPARRLDAPPQGTTVIDDGNSCGSWSGESVGNYEAAVAWADVGVASPLDGAFAQRFMFADTVRICAIILDLTQIGGQHAQSCDLYIWSGSSNLPAAVVSTHSNTPGPIAHWPNVSRHSFTVDACVTGETWIGYWANWSGADEGWYVAANVGEDIGKALTYVASGVADRGGWQSLSVVWERIANIGISVRYDAVSCTLTPTHESTWGRIKVLYARP